MDAPLAKYTVDLCIEQSIGWKIFIAQRQDWVNSFESNGQSWHKQIVEDPNNHFQPYSLRPGSGIIFSGSSQWHYRDRITEFGKTNHCHLIFFHFIPKGMEELIQYHHWAKLFDIAELDTILEL